METLKAELQKTDWSRFETAYGDAIAVPSQLERLFSDNHADAMEAAHELWCGLCHQHAYVSSAALPALPFLLRALGSTNDQLKDQVLDIFCGFAVCTCTNTSEGWKLLLRQALLAEYERFEALKRHEESDVADWGEEICKWLDYK